MTLSQEKKKKTLENQKSGLLQFNKQWGDVRRIIPIYHYRNEDTDENKK